MTLVGTDTSLLDLPTDGTGCLQIELLSADSVPGAVHHVEMRGSGFGVRGYVDPGAIM